MPEPGMQADGEELFRRMRELEARVARLEQRLEPPSVASAPAAPQPAQVALVESFTAIPALGRAVLAMAGAYVLRALTESHAVPAKLGVFAGIAYAVFWLVWAARIPAGRRAETALYSLTSALVLGPLLWESTLRLGAVSTWTAAAVLLAFMLTGLLISWRKNLLIVATISILAGVLTAAALLISTHDVMPFLLLLLALAAAVEISACLDHWLAERWLAAAAADLAILLATYLVTSVRGLPENYAPIPRFWLMAAQVALPGIYLASTMVRTLLRGSTFSVFETAQLAMAFLLAVEGGLQLGYLPTAAAVCLVCGTACYMAAFRVKGRNFPTYLAFGFVLVVAGTRIALPVGWAAAAWSGLALGCLIFGGPAFRWHGCGYLVLALAFSGALAQATAALLAGTDSSSAIPALVAETAVALACLALALRAATDQRVLRTVLAAAAFWPAAAVGTIALAAAYHLAFGPLASHAYCSAARTAMLAAGAVLLAWTASHGKRVEFAPLVYPVMILGAYRLLLVDLRQDNKTALVISLLVYGTALLLLPQLMKPRQTTPS